MPHRIGSIGLDAGDDAEAAKAYGISSLIYGVRGLIGRQQIMAIRQEIAQYNHLSQVRPTH
jgi:hypothetical protein